jgi:hypothetical protein
VRSSEEIARIRKRIEGFNWKRSPAWRYLSLAYGPTLSQDELISIAELISPRVSIKLDRDARRRKCVMIKWFEEHWALIQPLLCSIVLESQ